ncbi:MAG TPA: hypothetical protein VJN71_10375 [Nitrososphaerales archaeon]|nr:hypothetical protein [Nitrososphaerales archaeon]
MVKPEKRSGAGKVPLNWLLTHPGKIRSETIKRELKKARSTRELIEKWKEELWMGK